MDKQNILITDFPINLCKISKNQSKKTTNTSYFNLKYIIDLLKPHTLFKLKFKI